MAVITQDPLIQAVERYVAVLAFQYCLEHEGRILGRDLLAGLSQQIPLNPKSLRLSLESAYQFRRTPDNAWEILSREPYTQRPLERMMVEILQGIGKPLPPEWLGKELSYSYPHSPESLTTLVKKLAQTRPNFFLTSEGKIGLRDWLLKVPTLDPEEVLWENFDEPQTLEPFQSLAQSIDWQALGPIDGAITFLDQAKQAVSNKILQFYQWQADPEHFDAIKLLEALLSCPEVAILDHAEWIGPSLLKEVPSILARLDREGPVVELLPEDLPKPVTVEPQDLDLLYELLTGTSEPENLDTLLHHLFPQLMIGDPNYDATRTALDRALRNDPRFLWVGWDRWLTARPIPEEIQRRPEILEPLYVDLEFSPGQPEDVELTDEGLEEDLAEQIRQPLCQYGGIIEALPDRRIRCVITYNHHQAGTLPVPSNSLAFPRQPNFILVTGLAEDQYYSLWINHSLELLFGLRPWYQQVRLPASGGVFYFEPTEALGRYRLVYSGEKDNDTYIEESRLKDLLSLREQAMTEATSTREIITRILTSHSRGISFTRLYAETLVVRMVTPRLVAGILSAYHGFTQHRGLWSHDARAAQKGFKRQKKKYIVKR